MRMKSPKPAMTLTLAAFTLSACAAYKEHRDPELTSMVLDETTMPEVNTVYVPQPEPEPVRMPDRAEATSLWRTGSTGFFGDHRASRVGDILTVTIDIDDEAELENESRRSRSSGNEIDGSTFLGYESKLDAILPGINADDLPSGSIIDLSGESSSRGRGSIARNEKIKLKVAVMIIRRLGNGNLVIAGRQEVKVNSELRELRVAGIIRPVDVDMTNAIPYDKIAEARISYGGKGQLTRVQTPRYGEDMLDVVLPY
ncbi:flagellar basal body L-ring protein FlgH [Psychromarinibacter sp. S121]|uniref:flagellar basal body L-ring protein FlgH n=1 Tax=Psychromarinibacter sp. S121 TaxID=3415127 RepID=UPI003C7D14F4